MELTVDRDASPKVKPGGKKAARQERRKSNAQDLLNGMDLQSLLTTEELVVDSDGNDEEEELDIPVSNEESQPKSERRVSREDMAAARERQRSRELEADAATLARHGRPSVALTKPIVGKVCSSPSHLARNEPPGSRMAYDILHLLRRSC